jgi:multidrug efflux pump subunit AcrB
MNIFENLSTLYTHYSSSITDCSRVFAFQVNVDTALKEIENINDVRDLMHKTELQPKPIAFSQRFLSTETELVLKNEVIFNLVYAIIAIAIVSALVLVRPMAILLILVIVCMVDVCIVGTMYFWGVQINTG